MRLETSTAAAGAGSGFSRRLGEAVLRCRKISEPASQQLQLDASAVRTLLLGFPSSGIPPPSPLPLPFPITRAIPPPLCAVPPCRLSITTCCAGCSLWSGKRSGKSSKLESECNHQFRTISTGPEVLAPLSILGITRSLRRKSPGLENQAMHCMYGNTILVMD